MGSILSPSVVETSTGAMWVVLVIHHRDVATGKFRLLSPKVIVATPATCSKRCKFVKVASRQQRWHTRLGRLMHHLKRFMVSRRSPWCSWLLINRCAQVLMIKLLVWLIVSRQLLLMIRQVEQTWIIGNLSLVSMINRWRLNGAVSSILVRVVGSQSC